MSSQFTRGQDQGTRRAYGLSAAQAGVLLATVGPDGQARNDAEVEAVNEFWSQLGKEMGFRWTTVDDVAIVDGGTGGTFTATPDEAETPREVVDEALAWLAGNDGVPSDPTDAYTRDAIVRAYAAGRDHGFTMGACAPQPSQDRYRVAWGELRRHLDWMQETRAYPLLRAALGFSPFGLNLAVIAVELIVRAYPQMSELAGRGARDVIVDEAEEAADPAAVIRTIEEAVRWDMIPGVGEETLDAARR